MMSTARHTAPSMVLHANARESPRFATCYDLNVSWFCLWIPTTLPWFPLLCSPRVPQSPATIALAPGFPKVSPIGFPKVSSLVISFVFSLSFRPALPQRGLIDFPFVFPECSPRFLNGFPLAHLKLYQGVLAASPTVPALFDRNSSQGVL